MKIRLYTAAQNSAGERVRIALNLKGVPFEYVPVVSTTEPDYLRLNPQALMPTLAIDGRTVSQSLPAIELLNECFPNPPLLPGDAILRAQSRSFATAICAEAHAITVRRVRRYLAKSIGASDDAVTDWYAHWTAKAFEALEQNLAARSHRWPFCYAEHPTIADIALVPQVANARRFSCDLSCYPLLTEIADRCAKLPAFEQARPENQRDFVKHTR